MKTRRSNQLFLTVVVLALLQIQTLTASVAGAANDRIDVRLQQARDDYAKELKTIREGVLSDLEDASSKALKAGDKQAHDAIAADKTAFVSQAKWPRTIDVRKHRHQTLLAANDLATEYRRAIRDYTRRKQLDDASQIEASLAGLHRAHFRYWRHSRGYFVRLTETDWEELAPSQWHLLYKFSINPKTLARHLRSWLTPLGKEPFWHVAGISGCR
jgi:hypothetical protein